MMVIPVFLPFRYLDDLPECSYSRSSMLSTQDIIEKLWNAQGYGNLAVWQDGSTRVIEPGETPVREGKPPLAVFKPIVLVARFPMLDHALSNAELQETIEKTIRDAGGEISRP